MKTFHFFPFAKGTFLPAIHKVLLVLLISGFIQSCTEPDQIGLQFIDDQAFFKRTDTVSVVGFIEREDSLPTNRTFQNLLGMMHDPEFGKTRASIVAEFRIPINNFSLGSSPVLDSLVLSFHYTGQYAGNIETLQTIQVFELSENLPPQGNIISSHPIQVYPVPVGQRILRPAPRDSVLVDTIFRHPHFNIRLSDQLGQKIVNANGTAAFRNVQNFLEYFKGLKITVENNFNAGGSIFNINMFGQYTHMTLYYHNATDTVRVQRSHSFRVSEFSRRYTRVEHFDFEGANPLVLHRLQNPLVPSDSLLFVKPLGGLRNRIRLPHLKNLAELPNVTINQAKLIIPIDEAFLKEGFEPAQYLHLFQISPQGTRLSIPDSDRGIEYFGGQYNPLTRQYAFNITKHIQEVLKGANPNNDLILIISGASDNANRVVLRGSGRNTNPMRLQIVYTSFR